MQASAATNGVTPGEARRITVQFIGVEGGYLGDFNRGELDQFYLQHGLDIDIDQYEGTTRARFIDILLTSTPNVQAQILRGVIDRFPVEEGPSSRTEDLRAWASSVAARCDGHMVTASVPANASTTVARALADAETLLGSAGASSALDRVHTALHGYLRAACDAAGIEFRADDPSTTALFSQLRKEHPRLQPSGPRAQDIETMQRALATVVDVLSPIRNRATLAHPNDELLGQDEARLAINAARAILGYLESKLR